jgi:hypothetical protein
VPAPGPGRAAAQRPSISLRERAAWQRVWVIPPPPGGYWRLWNRGLGATSGKNARIGFTAEPASGKNAADEGKGFISGEEPFAYHPKMGRYADLHNHLLSGELDCTGMASSVSIEYEQRQSEMGSSDAGRNPRTGFDNKTPASTASAGPAHPDGQWHFGLLCHHADHEHTARSQIE